MDFAARRRAGFIGAMQSNGLHPDEALLFSDEMTEPNGHRAACEMLDAPEPATAVIASSIIPAMGVKRAVEDRGLVVGKDVSIICFDDEISYLPNGRGDPIFTAARSSVRAAGRRCAEILLEQIMLGTTHIETELWEADLVLGQSTGPVPTQN